MSKELALSHLLIDDKLRIAITNTCNLQCFYCHNEGQSHFAQKRFLSYEYVEKLVRWIWENHVCVESVNLTGGEPLLHPDLIRIIDAVRTITKDIRINTNGTLLTKDRIDLLVQHGVTALKIGIDSFAAQKNSKAEYCPGSPSDRKRGRELVEDTIAYANLHLRVVLNTVVTSYNADEVSGIIASSCRIGLPRIKILQLHDMDPRQLNQNDAVSEEYKTNQSAAAAFSVLMRAYEPLAVRMDRHPDKGRSDLFFRRSDLAEGMDDSLFEIRFCEDICLMNACQKMFTEISADEKLLICPKYHITAPLSFDGDSADPASAIRFSTAAKCSNAKRGMRERFRPIGAHGFDTAPATADIFVRASCPSAILLDHQKELASAGFRYVADLRRIEEVEKQRSPYEIGGILEYHHIPLTPEPYSVKSETPGRGREYYKKLIAFPENVKAVFEFLANTDGKTIIHCAGGKSRCGVVSALLLMLSGVRDEIIADDYCMAYFDLYGLERYHTDAGAGARDILELIACIRNDYTDVDAFLRSLGISEHAIAELKAKMKSVSIF